MSVLMRARGFWFPVLLCGLALLSTVQAAGAAPVPRQPGRVRQQSPSAAATAERNGDYVAAETGYKALAASADPSTAAAGQLALGRLLVRLGRSAQALAPLQAVMSALGAAPDGLRATFLLGEAQVDLRQNQAAAASFQSYLDGGGPAAGYAALERARVLQAEKDDMGAEAALMGPLQASSLTLRRAALQVASGSHERLGDPAQAVADLEALVDSQPPPTERAAGLLELGRLYHLAGDDGAAAGALQSIVSRYPDLTAAGKALDQLQAWGIAGDPVQRAIALFSLRRNGEARVAFQALLTDTSSGEPAALVTYYLARIADRADENDTALAGYQQAYALAPGGALAPEALWRRAVLLTYLLRYGDAQNAYATLVQQFPQSGNAAEATFAVGLMAYFDGRPADAEVAWSAIGRAASGAELARAELWLGKLARARGDVTAAAMAFAQAQAVQPSGYYGLRAEVLARNAGVALTGGAIAAPGSDRGEAESWLTARFGPEDQSGLRALQATQDWTEGMELDALGWQKTPNLLLRSALNTVVQEPWTLYRAARALAGRGRTDLALEAAVDLLRLAGVQTGGALNAPAALLRLAYPLDYLNLVNQDAAESGIDPLIIYAVARQESAFDPVAGSSAGALGLLQLEPATAQEVADQLGLADFTSTDLLRPLINLRLGTVYLARQAQAQDGDFSRMLAAYNGGGTNASRWARLSGADPDSFYETVDFSETRLYVRLVSANFAIYNSLYRSASHPTLLPAKPVVLRWSSRVTPASAAGPGDPFVYLPY